MLKIFLILVIALSMARCVDPCSAPPPEGGEVLPSTFTSVEGRFKIGLPETARNSKPNDDNSFKWFILNRGEFHIIYYDRRKEFVGPESSEAIFNGLRDLARSKGGQVEFDSEIKLNGHPGRDLRIRDERGLKIQRMYYVGTRLYVITAFVPSGLQCAVDDVVKRLDTFEIIEEKVSASTSDQPHLTAARSE